MLVALTAAAGMIVAMTASSADAAARGIATVCGHDPPAADYDDRDRIAAAHLDAVDCLTDLGVVQGHSDEDGVRYLPGADVPRGQMATFVAAMLVEAGVDLPAPTDQGYEDVGDGHTHADAIRQLTQIGVVTGVSADRYEPGRAVTRAQMSAYLIRAAAHQAGVEHGDLQGGSAPFSDVPHDATHRPSIEGAYELGISDGVGEQRYAPDATVRRDAMASFVARTLDAMTARQTVSDRDRGEAAHTVFTFLGESGHCFQVKAGEDWVSRCDPATDETLQLRQVTVEPGFTVVAGLVTDDVTRVVAEFGDGDAIDLPLIGTRSPGLLAWASPILHQYVDAIVAYEGETEVARTAPDDDAESPPFQADTEPSTGDGSGEPVTVTDVRIAHHQTYDRVVFDVIGAGLPGWDARYVDRANQQGSGHHIEMEGDAVIELVLRNVQYPPPDERHPQGRVDGVDTLREVYVSNVYEARSQFFLGISTRTPFRVFTLEDPPRLVVDVVHPSAAR